MGDKARVYLKEIVIARVQTVFYKGEQKHRSFSTKGVTPSKVWISNEQYVVNR